MLSVFAPDVVYHDLFYRPHHGHDGLQPSVTIAEWRFAFTVANAVPSGAGLALRFDGVSVFRHGADGRCRIYRRG